MNNTFFFLFALHHISLAKCVYVYISMLGFKLWRLNLFTSHNYIFFSGIFKSVSPKCTNYWKAKRKLIEMNRSKMWEPTACELCNLTFTPLQPWDLKLNYKTTLSFLLLETTFINWSDDRWASSSPNILSSSTSTILHLPVVAWINQITVLVFI